jgi:hypothetical protein
MYFLGTKRSEHEADHSFWSRIRVSGVKRCTSNSWMPSLHAQRQIDPYCDLKTWGIVMKQVVMVRYGCRARFQSFALRRSGFCCRSFGGTCHISRLIRKESGTKVFSMLSGRYLWPMGAVRREVLVPGQYEQRKGKVTRMILWCRNYIYTFGVAVTLTQMLTTPHTHAHTHTKSYSTFSIVGLATWKEVVMK